MTFVNIKIIPYPLNGCQLLVIGCPEAFSFKKLSDFTPFFDEARTVRQQHLQSVILRRSVGAVSNFASEKRRNPVVPEMSADSQI